MQRNGLEGSANRRGGDEGSASSVSYTIPSAGWSLHAFLALKSHLRETGLGSKESSKSKK